MKIVLKPLGAVDAAVLRHLREELRPYGETAIASMSALPAASYDPALEQYRATALFDACLEEPGDRVIGVTEAELCAEKLKSVFGYAQIGGRAAVISLSRLQGRRASRDGRVRLRRLAARRRERFLDRCVKEAVHEFGHTLGLAHDDRHPDCVMHYSSTLADTDRKRREYCPDCARQAALILKRPRT